MAYLGLDKFLLWGVVMGITESSAASLTSNRKMPEPCPPLSEL